MAMRKGLRLAFEIAAVMLTWVTPAYAAPVLGAFFAGLLGTLPLDLGLGIGLSGLPGLAAALGSFIGANALTLAVVGASLLVQQLQSQSSAAQVFNIKLENGPRRHAVGQVKVGGQALYGAFRDGAFWYLIVHCDEELITLDHYRLDDIEVTLDGSHLVTTADFKAYSGGFLGIGQGLNSFFSIWTETYSPSNPVPPPLAAFTTANPDWTANHKLAGTTYSIVKIEAVDAATRPKIFKWQQGPFKIGEPGLTLIGTFARVHDPREEDEEDDDPSTWGASRNAALIWAWNRYRQFGFAMPMSAFNWELIAAAADICDQVVTDKNDDEAPRYACGLTFDESRGGSNIGIEQQVLAACDGMVLYDDAGKIYIKVGAYEAPTVAISAARDVMGMQSQIIEDGEAQLDGVEVTYTEPEYGYILQPAAPWLNPRYYLEGSSPRLAKVTIAGCQNHNQAVRLAKAIGEMTQPAHQLAPTIGLRALLCRRERIIDLDYDEDFSGEYQISVPVSFDLGTLTGTMNVVPVSPNSWTLLEGEEGDRPRRDVAANDTDVPLPENVVVAAVPVAGSNGNSVRLEASFDAPSSAIYSYEFEYSSNDGDSWNAMGTDMPALKALSPILDADAIFLVHWRTKTTGGNYSDYSDPPISVGAFANLTADMTVIRADSTHFTADAA